MFTLNKGRIGPFLTLMTPAANIEDKLTTEQTENGLLYVIDGNSTEFGWKLTPGYPAIVWTNADYRILEDCVGIRFEDIAVSIDGSGRFARLMLTRRRRRRELFMILMILRVPAAAPFRHRGMVRRLSMFGSFMPIRLRTRCRFRRPGRPMARSRF